MLSVDEVRAIIERIRTIQNKTYIMTVYSCGLRLQEALNLCGDFWTFGDVLNYVN